MRRSPRGAHQAGTRTTSPWSCTSSGRRIPRALTHRADPLSVPLGGSMTQPLASSARFEIVRPLGGGGMGLVYEAIDRERDVRVALKTLRHFSPQALARFKREFRALEAIRHPNLVSLGELICEGGLWFFTME